jgi:hypothetical protein
MTDSTLTALEDRRLAELKEIVARRAAAALAARPAAAPAKHRRRITRPALALATAAAAAAVVLVASTGGGTPAFAVTRQPNGIIDITLTNYGDTGQLSAELRKLGVPASVFYVPAGQECLQDSAAQVTDIPAGLYQPPQDIPGVRGAAWQMQINTGLFKPGQFLIFGLSIGTGPHDGKVFASSTFLATGEVTSCRFLPASDGQLALITFP